MSAPPESLRQALLTEAPKPVERSPERAWAYPWLGVLAMSVFVLYHLVILLAWNVPSKGLSARVQQTLLRKLDGRNYMYTAGSTQSWSMFAPNPNRTNTFMRVLLEDQDGEVWDLKHDIYGVDRHPYIFYDRMGKVRRRIDDKGGYQRAYGAWVCRQWEREHQGKSAKSVRFIKRYTKIPRPSKTRKSSNPLEWGYHPWRLPVKQKEQHKISCEAGRNAQLPDHLREKYGFPPAPEGTFKAVTLDSWWAKKERAAKREARKREQGESEGFGQVELPRGGPLREKVPSPRAPSAAVVETEKKSD